MLAVFEEARAGLLPDPQRLIFSVDDGSTWTEGDPYLSQYNLWWYRAVSPESNVILVGNVGPANSVLGEDAVIARSEDGGLTWGRSDTGALMTNPVAGQDQWRSNWTEVGDGNRVLCGGFFKSTAQGQTFNLLVSDDLGSTFLDWRILQTEADTLPEINCLAHCGDGILFASSLAGITIGGSDVPGRPLWRSLDNGETWARSQLVSTDYPFGRTSDGLAGVFYLGGLRVIAVGPGVDYTDWSIVPLVWISDDLGDSWREVSGQIISSGAWSTAPTDWNNPQWAAGWGDGTRIAIGNFCQPSGGQCPKIIFSEDAGLTWAAATFPTIEAGETETEAGWGFIGKGDDGSLSATIYRDNDTELGLVSRWEIWRGVGSWDMGTGPCGEPGPPPPPAHPYHFAHVPERDTYQPCPQECST